ncbi:hypothetical protein ACJZ2D_016348 [Fusarium nematophilum]
MIDEEAHQTARSSPASEAHSAFWDKQNQFSHQSAALMQAAIPVILNGPELDILGVRSDADLACKVDIPNTRLCVAEETELENPTYAEVTFSPRRLDDEAWRNWDIAARPDIEKAWPRAIPEIEYPWYETTELESSSERSDESATATDEEFFSHQANIRNHPGHFKGDWNFFHGASVTLTELSFTQLGFPSILFRKYGVDNQDWIRPRHGESSVFGRSWNFKASGRVMPWHIFAFVASQITLGHDLDISEVVNCTIVFLKRYICSWPRTNWTNWCCLGDQFLHAQFHIRHLSLQETAVSESTDSPSSSGMVFERDSGHVTGLGLPAGSRIVETRSAVAIITEYGQPHPCYTLMTLTDDGSFKLHGSAEQRIRSDLGLEMCHEFGGIAIFQAAIGVLLTEWGSQWTVFLNKMTTVSNAGLKDILGSAQDGNTSHGMKPEMCLISKKLLLKSRQMIKELSQDFRNQTNDLKRSISVMSPQPVLEKNQKALDSHHGKLEHALLDCIRDKLEDLDAVLQAHNYEILHDKSIKKQGSEGPKWSGCTIF